MYDDVITNDFITCQDLRELIKIYGNLKKSLKPETIQINYVYNVHFSWLLFTVELLDFVVADILWIIHNNTKGGL